MAAEQHVLAAVQNKKATSKQGVLQRMFAMWFDAFVYNQIWEDPRVDLQALQLNEDSRVLTISSGGCNALNYLAAGPRSVTAVDLNRYHIYLLRLKLAAVRSLPTHEQFFNFFGAGRNEQNVADYYKYIAPDLDEETRDFWEGNGLVGLLVKGDRINYFAKGGLYEHSRNGYFLRFFHKFAALLGCRPEKVLTASSIEEQVELYDRYIDPFFDSVVIKTIGKLPVTMFGLGIPPQQYEELKKDLADDGSIIDIYRARAKRLACEFPIDDNYFAWQAFARKYDTTKRKAIPDYLKEENFEKLKENAFRLNTDIGSVTDQIKDNPFDTFDRFVFLDAQDWMNAEVMTDLWQSIADKAAVGSRIIFRTAGATSPIEKNLPRELAARFEYKADESAELFKQDRASIYGGFHLYVLAS